MNYFKYFDITKLLFSFIIVSIHIKNNISNTCWTHLSDIAVPMFFTMSAILFWNKIKWNHDDISIIKHYIKRLVVLISAWSILLIPFWLPQFISQYPTEWYYYLLPKLFLYGGCRGGYFIMSLIYGTIIIYVMHRLMNRHIAFIICFFITTYYQFVVTQVFPDFLNIRYNGSLINTDFLPFRFLLYMELAIYIIPDLTIVVTEKLGRELTILALFTIIIISFINSAGVYYICSIIFLSLFCSLLCSIRCSCLPSFSLTIRKMSIVIFLLHFILIDFGESFIISLLDFNFISYNPLCEYLGVLFLTVFIAYIIVTIVSNKISYTKYLY